MNIKRHAGVALVQVLLITALLLLLVIQLSKSAHNNVNIATKFKEKAEFTVKAESTFNQTKYMLATQPRDLSGSLLDQHIIQFHGDPVEVQENITIEIQDLAGLLSTNFLGAEWINYVKGDSSKIETLKIWQAIDENMDVLEGNRNARLPYIEEINLLNGWEDIKLHHLTHIETGFFNAATAPLSLLESVYTPGIVSEITQLRNNNQLTIQNMRLINGIEDDAAFPPSTFAQITVKGLRKNSSGEIYSRTRMYSTQPDKTVPILEIGIGTL